MKILICLSVLKVFECVQTCVRDFQSKQDLDPDRIFFDYRPNKKLRGNGIKPIPSPKAPGIDRRIKTNPCEVQYDVMPDFNSPGRRVSEVKCYGFIWQIKRKHDIDKNEEECEAFKEAHPEYLGGQINQFGPFGAIGGHPTEAGEYPHTAAVGWKSSTGIWIFKCGGTLISNEFVLTAAHCSQTSPRDSSVADPTPKIVRLGDKNIADSAANEDVEISEIIVHPSYQAPRKYYDIALLRLSQGVLFSKLVQPACLWTKSESSLVGTEAILTGWGVTETGGKTTSPELQAAKVEVISSATCDQLLRPFCNRHWCGVEDHQLCAGKLEGGVDACQGDSGGPLQVKIDLPVKNQGQMSFVIGVTSFGIGCARANTPGIYTRVSSFVDWIEENVWPYGADNE